MKQPHIDQPAGELELPSHEVLSQLVRDDPQAYEALRRDLIESFIDSAPARLKTRLRGVQFRVDCKRRLSRSALGSTVSVYKLMWQSFLCLNREWQDLVGIKEGFENLHGATPAAGCLPKQSARIIEFLPRLSREP